MAVVKPFRAVRPGKEYAEQIAALPYDVYHRKEAGKIVRENPLSFLAIDRPETNFDDQQDIYEESVYKKAGELLRSWMEKGYFAEDSDKGFYLYELTWRDRVQNGIVGVSSVDDYLNNVILKHENTREEKEKDRIRHIEACQAQTGPIFLAYKDQKELKDYIEEIKKKEADYDFTGEDGVRHRVFSVFDPAMTAAIEECFKRTEKVYIADGHHRCAAAAKVCQKRREMEKAYDEDAEYNYFLSVLFPQSELEILDYNRLVRDLNGLSEKVFLEKLRENFEIEKKEKAYAPAAKGEFGMYLEGQWYSLKFKHMEQLKDKITEALDVSILQNYCLDPILGIKEPRTDVRLDFCGGIRGLGELERRVNTDCRVAFSVKAVSMEELFRVADAGFMMPPKSTWFEPKLRSGLFLHKI